MRKLLTLGSSILGTVALASNAGAVTLYVSPTGTADNLCISGCTTRDAPCDLGTGASTAAAGDTVILMDGVYKTQLYVANSGTASAWITFKADDCATPIIEGAGVAPDDTNQDTGVGSSTATYVKFIGLISRGWSAGFSNGWTGTDTTTSNGNFEYDNCIADGNGRTGFTFFSATGITIKNSISAHNGSSTAESWSSGITLYEAQGGSGASVIEGNVSFENMDAQKHTDGSGFIIDEYSDGATFVNNVAFRNGGSCLRLTKSKNCKFINNTCYHDALDTADQGPSNPGEVYFTMASDNSTTTGVSFLNNAFVATGTGPGAMAIYNQPTSGWSNNQVSTGSVTFFTSPEGTNADFTLASGSMLAAKGGTGTGVPTNDVGFDPKCITKKAPTMVGLMAAGSWWQYSVDVDYIKSLGGVAKCFNTKARSGTPDIGAYANGAVTTSAGACTPAVTGSGGMGGLPASCAMAGAPGAGGMDPGAGGMAVTAGGMGSAAGGATSVGGATSAGGSSPGGMGAGGTTSSGGTATTGAGSPGVGSGGAASGVGGAATGAGGSSGTSTGPSTGGASGSGTAPAAGGSSPGAAGAATSDTQPSGCGCRVAGESPRSGSLAGFGLVGLALAGFMRRRRAA